MVLSRNYNNANVVVSNASPQMFGDCSELVTHPFMKLVRLCKFSCYINKENSGLMKKRKRNFDLIIWLLMLNLCRAKTCFFGKSCINKRGRPWCTTESNFRTSCCKDCCAGPGSIGCPCSSA